jgi:1-acyl-sn-glycerol-3-phosphate acyltransferase
MFGINKLMNPTGEGPVRTDPLDPVPTGVKWLNFIFIIPLIAIATIFFGTLAFICGLWDKSGRQQHLMARQWARVLLIVGFAPIKLVHAERFRGVGTAVYASNHLSYYDTPAIFATLPFQFRILAKAPLFKVPFIGWYLTRSGQVSIDQSSARAGIASLARGVATIKQGLPMVIFPEGGRTATGDIQPMLAGAAYIAIKAQVPLVPLTLVGTYELLPIHVYALSPRPLKLIVGEPLSTEGLTTKDAEALTDKLKQVIHETYIAEHDIPNSRTN